MNSDDMKWFDGKFGRVYEKIDESKAEHQKTRETVIAIKEKFTAHTKQPHAQPCTPLTNHLSEHKKWTKMIIVKAIGVILAILFGGGTVIACVRYFFIG